MAFCSKCGNELLDGAQFCPNCGQAIDNDSAPQQEENLSQLNEEQEEEGLTFWMKMLILVLWPIGLIMGIVYKKKEMNLKAKEAFKYSAIPIVAGLFFHLSQNINGCSSTTNSIEETAKDIMIEEFKEDGTTLVFKDFRLVHKSGNEYTGVADCYVNGDRIKYSLKAFSDGRSVQIEWVPFSIETE